MKFHSALLTTILLPAITFVPACASTKPDIKSLVKDVDAYHRDLLFQRYDIAARRIAPGQRMAWLDAILSQNLRFAEIDILATEPCATPPKNDATPDDPIPCVDVLSQMQWFSGSTPTLQSGRVRTTWQYDSSEKTWFISEQETTP